MSAHKDFLQRSIFVSVLTFWGCGTSNLPQTQEIAEPTLVETIRIVGFDKENEPVIKKWSDGTLWIHFGAMPPFFAVDEGIEDNFQHFEQEIQAALGIPISREDRELFLIKNPASDTANKAKAWLEGFHQQTKK
jgi:hypothetical protein